MMQIGIQSALSLTLPRQPIVDAPTLVMPVMGVPDEMKSSAALLISTISSSLKRCTHLSGWFW